MKAIILMGGYGTRLRPLTLSVPKPLIHFCNKSIVEHQISALIQVNVTHVILAVSYQPDCIESNLQELREKFNVEITCSVEKIPLGTAGPISLAEKLLTVGPYDDFFVLNSDIICDYPLKEMLEFHKNHKGSATMLITVVEEPKNFGVVLFDNNNKITNFIEKPTHFVGNYINAGLYLLNKSVFQILKPQPTSIEKEIFPLLVSREEMYCLEHKGYWIDIGQPAEFLRGTELYLKQIEKGKISPNMSETLAKGPNIQGNVIIHPTATVASNCLLGPNVVVGANCHIGEGVRIKNSSILDSVLLEGYNVIDQTIVGWESKIGKWAYIKGLTVLGRDVTVAPECFVNQSIILPHKRVVNSIITPNLIIM